jgi:integrase
LVEIGESVYHLFTQGKRKWVNIAAKRLCKMIQTAVIFDHRNRTPQGAEGPLEVRVTIDRKAKYIATGIKVRRSEWRQGVIVNRPDSDILNARLRVIVDRVAREVNQAIAEGRAIDVADVKRRVWVAQVDAASTSLLDWVDQEIDSLHLAEGTVKHYRTTSARLHEWGMMRRWADLTVENIVKWDGWLHQLPKSPNSQDLISDAGIYTYHKSLKALLNRAVMYGRLDRNPYDRLKGRFKRGDRESIDYLTDREMRAIKKFKPTPGSEIDVARDLFVFQAYTGLSYGDMQKFDIKDYKKVKGAWVNVGQRIKTGVPYTSQLLPPVVKLLKKYDWKVPQMGNTEYNVFLKAVGQACGIDRPLHSHMARHTFATWMLRQGVPIEHVSKMLGHTNIAQTQRYAKIVAEDIHSDFRKVAKKLK